MSWENEPHQGYSNPATFHADLLVSNERELYFAVRAIVQEHGDPRRAAPYVRQLVERALRGDTRYLTREEARVWRAELRENGGLGRVNWTEIAETQGQGRRRGRGRAESVRRVRHHTSGVLLRERSRHRRRVGVR